MKLLSPAKFWSLAGLLTASVLPGSAAYAEGFEEMISPVSNPVNFEDPRATTELRPIYLYHELGDEFATLGGDVQVYALQARLALSDRFALIATKDGYIDFNPNETLAKDSGWANIAAGFKYAFYKDDAASRIGTVGIRYEIPLGDDEVLQGEGDGVGNLFFSGAAKFGMVNAMAATGVRVPVSDDDSTFLDADVHFDVPVGDIGIGVLYPLVEMNLVQVLDGGNRLPIADEGADVINIGASEADGKGIVTMATGFRLRFCKNADMGVAYQVPLTRGAGSNLFDWRLTTDLIVRFDLLS
jgi:hypothetical protein